MDLLHQYQGPYKLNTVHFVLILNGGRFLLASLGVFINTSFTPKPLLSIRRCAAWVSHDDGDNVGGMPAPARCSMSYSVVRPGGRRGPGIGHMT